MASQTSPRLAFELPFEELKSLETAPPEELAFHLSMLEAEFFLWMEDENVLLRMFRKKPSRWSELSSGSIRHVIWWESVMSLLEAVLRLTNCEPGEGATAYLVGSLFGMTLTRHGDSASMTLTEDDAFVCLVAEIPIAVLASDVLHSYQTGLVSLQAVQPDIQRTDIIKKLESRRLSLEVKLAGSGLYDRTQTE